MTSISNSPSPGNRATPNRSEAMLRAILETTVDGIVTIDEQGRIELFNPAASRIFGYSFAEVAGQNVSLLMPEPFRSAHDGYISAYLQTGTAKIIGKGREVAGLHKNGRHLALDLAVSEVHVGQERFFTGICREISERKRTEEAVVAASEAERRLVGQELHDALGQQLTGIALLTKALEVKAPESLKRDAALIKDLARAATKEAKRLSHGLYPTELERHGLAAALRELTANQHRLYQIPCTCVGIEETPAFDQSTALHLYRIAQEAMNNAIRHGHPSKVDLMLSLRDGVFSVQIEDDGVGIPEELVDGGGMGLAIMDYRAHMIGGVLQIERRAEGGTRIRCLLPHAGGGE